MSIYKEKVIVITGASRGIGAATALLAAKSGYFVVVNYKSSYECAENICRKITQDGGKCISVKADISNADDVKKLYDKSMEIAGKVDVLVNNAGISEFSLFTDIGEKQWDRMFDTNVKGNFLVSKAFIPQMVHRKNGKIINISSVWGICGASCEVHYSASKAAVIGMTKALAKELGPSGITVNCVAPGVIDTDMNAAFSKEDIRALIDETPIERIGSPQDVAETVLFLASDRADFITGQVISPNGGFVI